MGLLNKICRVKNQWNWWWWWGGGGQHVSPCPNVSPHSSHPDCTLEYLVSDAGSKWQLLCSLSHPTTKHLIRLGDVMNLVATHYISCTNHSFVLIVLPHLHLIHTHTFKQHTSMQTLQSRVLAPANISERYSSCYLLSLCLTSDCPTLEL